MHTIIQNTTPRHRSRPVPPSHAHAHRRPNFDCREQPDAVKLTVYVPGVDASGIELEVRGPDLTITARKPHVVRVNWPALHLEGVQRDYRLRLRLGHGLDYRALQAELHDGVLTVILPKQTAATPPHLRHVA
jgi:HSP20 family molecular chaperone IbpA